MMTYRAISNYLIYYRQPTEEEVAVFKQWARDHWSINKPLGFEVMHPIVRDEWDNITESKAEEFFKKIVWFDYKVEGGMHAYHLHQDGINIRVVPTAVIDSDSPTYTRLCYDYLILGKGINISGRQPTLQLAQDTALRHAFKNKF